MSITTALQRQRICACRLSRIPLRSVFLLVLLAVGSRAQSRLTVSDRSLLHALPDTVRLFEGRLQLVNIYKRQLLAIDSCRALPVREQTDMLVRTTYEPFRAFWGDYVGDADAYRRNVVPKLLGDSTDRLRSKGIAFARQQIDQFFASTATRLERLTGRSPQGVWHLAFGHSATNMGGFGDGRMVLDVAHPRITAEQVTEILPHELNHQVYDVTAVIDTTARGLSRCINEGFAVYVHSILDDGRQPLARYLFYTDQEMEFCVQNREMILQRLRPFLLTSDPDHALALADRSQKIFKQGPGAIGYYVGFLIVDTYVQRHGKESWKDIYTIPVRTVLERSGL